VTFIANSTSSMLPPLELVPCVLTDQHPDLTN
jgi:hypothetical protein